jgi:hypothetical protein
MRSLFLCVLCVSVVRLKKNVWEVGESAIAFGELRGAIAVLGS